MINSLFLCITQVSKSYTRITRFSLENYQEVPCILSLCNRLFSLAIKFIYDVSVLQMVEKPDKEVLYGQNYQKLLQ